MDTVRRFLDSRPVKTRKEINKAVEKTALLIKAGAKRRSPVDTGRLKTSIKSKTFERELAGEVFTEVRYAIFVHEGTHKMIGRPFMAMAVRQLRPKINKFFEDAIKNILKR